MPPAFVLRTAKSEVDERFPFGPFRLFDEVHVHLVMKAVSLSRITRNAGANNVFPSGQSTFIARNDVVEVKIFAIKDFAAVLAGVFVALEDVMPGKFDLFFRHAVEHHENDDARDADFEVDGVDHLFIGIALRNVPPTFKIMGGKVGARLCKDDLRLPLEKQRKCTFHAADIHCLPKPV